MNVLAQIRNIEAAAQRMKADETRIQQLQHRRQATADEIQDATRDLVLALAADKGVLDLRPTEIAALFERMELPTATEAEGGDCGNETAGLQIGIDELVDVTVEYTSHKRGRRVALVQGLGLKRGGPNGFWSGRVDRDGLTKLIQAFPKKVKVHARSNPAAAGAPQQPEAVSEPSIDGHAADSLDRVVAESREDAGLATTSLPWPRPFSALPRRVASSVVGDDD